MPEKQTQEQTQPQAPKAAPKAAPPAPPQAPEVKGAPELPASAYDRPVFKWIAPEYLQLQRGPLWYAFALVIVVGLLLFALIQQSLTMVMLIIAIVIAYWVTHDHKPKVQDVIISTLGIKVAGKFHPYSNIRTFWIVYDPPYVRTLNFRTAEKIPRDVRIQLLDKDPAIIRNYLLTQIPEWEGKTESLSELWIRILKL